MGFMKKFFDIDKKSNDGSLDESGDKSIGNTPHDTVREIPAKTDAPAVPHPCHNQGSLANTSSTAKRLFTPLEDHETLVYHTDWGHRDYDVSEIQLRTMYNNRETDEMSDDFKKIITENLTVRNLCDVAREYGFYSTFIVGDRHTYFVYGIDNEYINTTEFVEHNGRLFPLEFVLENGYSYSEFFCCFKWTAINIDTFLDPRSHETDRTSKLLFMIMNDLEFLLTTYKRYNLEIPEYVLWDQSTVNYVHVCDAVVANPQQNGTIKNHYADVLVKTLQDIAVWCYPARSSDSIGYLAFVLGTRYNVFHGIKGGAHKIYTSQKNWNNFVWQAETTNPKAFYDSSFSPKEAEFILKGMRERWAPCRVVETNSDITKMEIDTALSSTLYNEESKKHFVSKEVTLRYCAFDEGLVDYLSEEYTEQVLSKECMDYGDQLIKELDTDEMAATTSHTGIGIISVAPYDLEEFVDFALEYHVNFGHPRAWRFRRTFKDGIIFVYQYHDIPVVNNFGNYGSIHRASSMTNSFSELRVRTPAYNGKIWLAEQSYQSGDIHPVPYSNYTQYLIDRGFLVSNDGMDIPIPDEATLKEHT